MTCEKSCGAVVYTVADGEIKYLLVANMDGNWGFPKGHMEGMETETETALREVYEEAHLNIQLIDGFRETDEYPLPQKPDCRKQVVYFLGTFQNQAVQCQPEEISESRLSAAGMPCSCSNLTAPERFSPKRMGTCPPLNRGG